MPSDSTDTHGHVDDRLSYLIHSNDIPSDLEVCEIQTIISQESDELSTIESQIKDLQDSLAKLFSQREEHSIHLRSLKATISAVRRLPPELVTEIFRLCCPTRAAPISPNEDSYIPQLVVSQICSGWRKVALAFGQLWNCVLFEHKSPEYHHTYGATRDIAVPIKQVDVELVKMWLSRSGSMPLDISLDYDIPAIAEVAVDQLLLPYVRQCRSITLRVPHLSLRLFMILPAESLPVLDSFTVLITRNSYSWIPARAYALQSAVRLRNITLEYGWIEDSDMLSISRSIPWFQITHLCIYGSASHVLIGPSTFLEILRQCNNLVDCCLRVSIDENAHGQSYDLSVLPRLRRLRLQSKHGFQTVPLLQSLVLPALEELEIPLGITDKTSIEILETLAYRSAYTLRVLWLTNEHLAEIHANPFQRLLYTTPSIVFRSIIGEVGLANLTAIAEYQVVPHLETLRIGFHWNHRREFIAMIESRRPRRLSSPQDSRSPLKCLILRCYVEDVEKLHQSGELDRWCGDGLAVLFEPK